MAARSPMPVPTYDQFIEPLLRVLAQHPDGVAARQAADAAAAALGVTEEQKQECCPAVRSRSTGTGRDGRTTG